MRERPDDDLPRLIFADWLDEHGQSERAEFIRLQCAVACGQDNVGRPLTEAARKKLTERAQELLEKHRGEWEARLRARGASARGYVRGFPYGVSMDVEAFESNAASL